MSEKYLHVVERLLLQEKKDFFASGFACCRHCAVQRGVSGIQDGICVEEQ